MDAENLKNAHRALDSLKRAQGELNDAVSEFAGRLKSCIAKMTAATSAISTLLATIKEDPKPPIIEI